MAKQGQAGHIEDNKGYKAGENFTKPALNRTLLIVNNQLIHWLLCSLDAWTSWEEMLFGRLIHLLTTYSVSKFSPLEQVAVLVELKPIGSYYIINCIELSKCYMGVSICLWLQILRSYVFPFHFTGLIFNSICCFYARSEEELLLSRKLFHVFWVADFKFVYLLLILAEFNLYRVLKVFVLYLCEFLKVLDIFRIVTH